MNAVQLLHKSTIALLLIPALLIAESTFAATRADEAPSVTVRYPDLDLNSSHGIASLYQRIQTAAVNVCRPIDGSQISKLAILSAWNECVAHSVADAVRRIHNEKLSAYQWERIRGWKFRSVDAPINVARR